MYYYLCLILISAVYPHYFCLHITAGEQWRIKWLSIHRWEKIAWHETAITIPEGLVRHCWIMALCIHLGSMEQCCSNRYGVMTVNSIRFDPDLVAKWENFLPNSAAQKWHYDMACLRWATKSWHGIRISFLIHLGSFEQCSSNRYDGMTVNSIRFDP